MGNDLGPILLTGAAGYLGRHVLARLTARRVSCVPTSLGGAVGISCDLTDAVASRVLLDRTRPSAIIHCAAMVPTSASAYDDNKTAESSVAMVKVLLANARCRVVLASSMTVYGEAVDFPVDEEGVNPPVAGYAGGKWMAEQVLFARHFPDDVALRLPGLFGPPRRTGLLYNAARSFLTRGKFELTAPAELWAAMAVDDAAEYLVRAAITPSGCPAQAVNVGYEGEFSVLSAVAQIAAQCNVEWHPPSMKVKTFSMRLQRLESRYGMLAVSFHQRLKEFVDAVGHDLRSESGVGASAT